jgi:hypothetical protein
MGSGRSLIRPNGVVAQALVGHRTDHLGGRDAACHVEDHWARIGIRASDVSRGPTKGCIRQDDTDGWHELPFSEERASDTARPGLAQQFGTECDIQRTYAHQDDQDRLIIRGAACDLSGHDVGHLAADPLVGQGT